MSAANTRDPFPDGVKEKGPSLEAFKPISGRGAHSKGSGSTAAPFSISNSEGNSTGSRTGAKGTGGSAPVESRKSATHRRVDRPLVAEQGLAEKTAASDDGASARRFSPRLVGAAAGLMIALLVVVVATAWLADRRLPAVNPDFPGGFAVPIGGVMPDFSASMVQGSVAPYGTVFSNFDLFGRVSVIIVWASWDPLSVEWLDQLQMMRLSRYYDLPVNWVGVSYHDREADAQRVVESTRTMDWPHLWLPQEPTAGSPSLRQLGFSWAPAIYVFDPQGQLRYMGWSPTEMDEMLEELR